MLTVSQLSKGYGQKTLFTDISLRLLRGDRIGLVGPNGAGKTTLFSIILGDNEPDAGLVELERDIVIGFLPQESAPTGEETVAELATSVSDEFTKIYQTLRDHPDPDAPEHLDAMERFVDLDGYTLEAKAKRILSGLAFRSDDFDVPAHTLSGGWIMRAHLARLLVMEPDLLMLDEPTNHLDIVSQHWLEQYLKHYQGAIIVISHDRAFLDEVANRTIELKLGNLNSFKGNYSYYAKETEKRLEVLRKAYKNQQKEISEMKDWINRFRSNVKKASMVQSRIKQLEKMELITIPRDEKKIFFRFPEPPPSSAKVITIKDLHKAYDDNVIFDGLDLRIDNGDRIAVLGVNGAGKSTLARIMAGTEPYQSGEIETGLNTVISYFAQSQAEELDPAKTVLQEVETSAVGNNEANPRGALGALLFSGDEALKKNEVLSGGEKNRVALAKMLMKPGNCLILDEPTNHLDIKSKEVLQDAINAFEGTVILVSHDRAFLDGVVNKVLEVAPGSTRMLTCNVTEYIERLEKETAEQTGG
jgi:ATP-binding cassette subfamily F protein 3